MMEFMGHYGKKRNGFDWGRGRGRRGGPTSQKWSSAHRPLGLIFIFSTPPFYLPRSGTTVRTAGWSSASRRTSTTRTRRPCGATRTSTCSSGWRPTARSSTPRGAGGRTSTATSCRWWCSRGDWTTAVTMTEGAAAGFFFRVRPGQCTDGGAGTRRKKKTRGMTCGRSTESRWTKFLFLKRKK